MGLPTWLRTSLILDGRRQLSHFIELCVIANNQRKAHPVDDGYDVDDRIHQQARALAYVSGADPHANRWGLTPRNPQRRFQYVAQAR